MVYVAPLQYSPFRDIATRGLVNVEKASRNIIIGDTKENGML